MAGLGVLSVLVGMTDTYYWNSVELLSMRVYSALTDTIYKKSLTLSPGSRQEYTSGEVVNLMVVDADKVKQAVQFITHMWACPVQVNIVLNCAERYYYCSGDTGGADNLLHLAGPRARGPGR